MTYVIDKSISLVDLLQHARWKDVHCTDPDHEHNSPVLYACVVDYRGHRISVVQDWDCYSVQIDDNLRLMVENVSRAQMLEFVEKETSKEKR